VIDFLAEFVPLSAIEDRFGIEQLDVVAMVNVEWINEILSLPQT